MIAIDYDIIPDFICGKLIEIYNQNVDKSFEWYKTFPINMKNLEKEDLFFLKKISQRISSRAISLFGDNTYIQSVEIVRWPVNSQKQLHYDSTMPNTILSSVTYLNEDYIGGETIFNDGLKIKPKIGKTLFFDGNKYFHGVSKVKRKTRYVLAMWYTNDLNNIQQI